MHLHTVSECIHQKKGLIQATKVFKLLNHETNDNFVYTHVSDVRNIYYLDNVS